MKLKLNLVQALFLLFLKLREAAYLHRLNDSRVCIYFKSSSIFSVHISFEKGRNIHFEVKCKIAAKLSKFGHKNTVLGHVMVLRVMMTVVCDSTQYYSFSML